MFALHVGQHHGASNAVEHIGGGRTTASLLQPSVPCSAHVRALRHLFASKSRGSPPPQGKAERRRIELGAAIPKIGPKRVRVRHPVSDYTGIIPLLYPNEYN